MDVKLDMKDWKILYELDNNCRQSCSQIGKKVGLPSEVVNYRIKKLEDNKIITHYMVGTDMTKVGIIHHKIYIKLKGITEEKEKELLNFLVEYKGANWVVTCEGSWDLMVFFGTTDLNKFIEFKNALFSKYDNYFNKTSLTRAVGATTYTRTYFLNTKEYPQTKMLLGKEKGEKLSQTDLNILNELSKNARMPLTEIARQIGSTARVVKYTMKKLEKEKVINGYKIAINYEKLGILFFKCFIATEKCDKTSLNRFIEYCKNHPNIIHHVEVLGEWDLEPEFEVKSAKQFYGIIKEMRGLFADIIKSVETALIIKEHKYTYY